MPQATIKDSGSRQQFDTGARRDEQVGKGRPDLLPFRAIDLLAKHFEAGAFKYGERNWEQGMPLSRYLTSFLRHAHQFAQGKRDEPHHMSALWNLACLIDTKVRIDEGSLPQELDDLDDFVVDPYPEVFQTLLEKAKAQNS